MDSAQSLALHYEVWSNKAILGDNYLPNGVLNGRALVFNLFLIKWNFNEMINYQLLHIN